MKKVLVTGASGFIGNEVLRKFHSEGYNLEAWDYNDNSCLYCVIKKVDMLDRSMVYQLLDNSKPDIIIHCAGMADVQKSVMNPDVDYNGNVTITHNLLFSLLQLKMTNVKFLFMSSAAVYGNPKELPIKEDTLLQPLSPYALHKCLCEDICKYFISNHGMDIKILRVFSAYGRGLKKQIFWDMYRKYVSTGELVMFGTGFESRDYINVIDVVESIFLIASKESKESIFNVANGEEITIKEVTESFAKQIGLEQKKIQFNGVVREGEPKNWKADISRIKELGYKKSVNITEGIARYVEWIESI